MKQKLLDKNLINTEKGGNSSALIWRFSKKSRLLFLVSIVSAAVASFADMLGPQIIRAAVDYAIGGKEAHYSQPVMDLVNRFGGFSYLGRHLWIMALALLAVALVRTSMQYVFRVSNTAATETLLKTMRDSLFSHIERLPYSWHMKNHTGDIIQRCTSDLDTLRSFVSEQLTNVLRIIILLILAVVFMLGMDVRLTMIALIPVPAVIAYSLVFHGKIGKGFLECDENEGILSTMAQENLSGVRVVRAFGRERFEKDRFEAQNDYYTGKWAKLAGVMSFYWSSQDILSGVEVMLVVIFGAVFCIRGSMTAGEYIAFISYNSMLVWPIRMLGRMISEMSKAGVSLDRINFIMNSEEEKEPDSPARPPMDGDIVFDHVSFAYEGCPEILHDISFRMKAGSTLGILGGTGSGKSTLMLLLDKMYELPRNCGTISIGGTDIRDIETAWLRKNIGMVLQEPFLFSRSIRENLAISSDSADMKEIRKAAQSACLDETIRGFSKGYETFVGERGVTLSGGQKQRAAIARMLTKDTPIMIFDDSLSAVDAETDARIRRSLQSRFGSASIILISHRISTLSKVDYILVLDEGKIAEQGTHAELCKAGGIYQRISEIQVSAREDA